MWHLDDADEGWCHPNPNAGSTGAISKTSAEPLADISANRLVEEKCRWQTTSNHQRRTEQHPLGSPEPSQSRCSTACLNCRFCIFLKKFSFFFLLQSTAFRGALAAAECRVKRFPRGRTLNSCCLFNVFCDLWPQTMRCGQGGGEKTLLHWVWF